MADRIFAGVLLLVTLGYGYIAFTVIRAPFQYDPLGPESWPQILTVVAVLCLAAIIVKPDIATLDLERNTFARLGAMVLLLLGYAKAYETIGFVPATLLFCTLASLLLGNRARNALLFGLLTGVLGYAGATGLLELNLPAGPIGDFLDGGR